MGHNLIMMSFLLCKVIRAITLDMEHVEQNYKVVICSTICFGHIYYDEHDVIKVEVTMTKQKFLKLLNLEINPNESVLWHF